MARVILAVILAGLLAGCTSQPSCYETPRNMRCMSGLQLERELSQ
ncbi:hypothetical protein RFN29_15100 [Mesorhizobium sp. VK22B]|uniref:Type IV secretion system protein VirB7 n=1 Tax=Mesorhizobium captivum TaxID=3072319 RepID=A0ABU4Z136_9HYPH|nr:hypothetical protein [Mesorhizobium sp. VK22B]MDX8492904.1 hypothetical protein [Mesorhizobium sp. VK22B]